MPRFRRASSTLLVMVVILSLVALTACGGGSQGAPAASNTPPSTTGQGSGTGPDTDNDGLPDSVEKTYGTNQYAADTDGDGIDDTQDSEPVSIANPIEETSTVPLPLRIDDSRVEDNETADHLEITLTNTGTKTVDGLEIYYTITDKKSQAQESYYVDLGLSLAAGEQKTVHFDNGQEPGHYPGNMNGLYGTSGNGLVFDVTLHSPGFQPLTFQVEKAEGTAEVPD